MILLIDIGNTLTKIAKNNSQQDHIVMIARHIETSNIDWLHEMTNLFEQQIKKINWTGIIISSVVPEKTKLMTKLIKTFLTVEPILINSKLIPALPIKINLNNQQIGSDFLALAVGANQYYGNCIVVSLGTATTYTIIQDGEFIGAIIGPGFTSAKINLVNHAALIQSFNIHCYPSLIGKTTNHALSVGYGNGFNFMIQGTLAGIKNELNIPENTPLKIVITGGAYQELLPFFTFDFEANQEILMYGLMVIYKQLVTNNQINLPKRD